MNNTMNQTIGVDKWSESQRRIYDKDPLEPSDEVIGLQATVGFIIEFVRIRIESGFQFSHKIFAQFP